jgi:hypothetical protein
MRALAGWTLGHCRAGAATASMLCLVCWAVDVRAAGGLAGSAQGATRQFCCIGARACCPHAVSTRIPRLTLPRPRAMLLVSDSPLDQTCPGARRSLVLPEDGTSDHAAGVLAAAWTGLTWQATTSLRTRSPPWRYVTVSPPVRLGAVIGSSFVRSQWSRLDRQRQRCPGTSTQVTAAASHVSPFTRPFAGCPGEVSLRRCSGPW